MMILLKKVVFNNTFQIENITNGLVCSGEIKNVWVNKGANE